MSLSELERVFRALADARVRYLVVGGVAVNVHGYARLTHDLDLVLRLEREHVVAALAALGDLGYRPLLPVNPEDFADEDIRREWHERRNVEVFSMTADGPAPTVDLFVREPFDFEAETTRALVAEIAPGLPVPFARLETLIAMKRATGRTLDLDDAEHLSRILELRDEARHE